MKIAEFFEWYDKQVEEERKILEGKGVEYTMSNEDKHHNFKKIGELLKCPHCGMNLPPQTVIGVYWLKHIFAIINYLNTGKEYSGESIFGRLHDSRNYESLMGGLFYDIIMGSTEVRKSIAEALKNGDQ